MATCKTTVKRLLDTYTYYAVLNEIRAAAKSESQVEGKALATALFESLQPAERLDDAMEPEGGGGEEGDDDEGEDEPTE